MKNYESRIGSLLWYLFVALVLLAFALESDWIVKMFHDAQSLGELALALYK